jgi:hypothetical protein
LVGAARLLLTITKRILLSLSIKPPARTQTCTAVIAIIAIIIVLVLLLLWSGIGIDGAAISLRLNKLKVLLLFSRCYLFFTFTRFILMFLRGGFIVVCLVALIC